jgi:hypothetical protein
MIEINHRITKLFGPAESIASFGCSAAHLHRWTVFHNKRFKVCLDHCLDLEGGNSEDYPNRFISFGIEKSENADDAARLSSSDQQSSWMLLIERHS